VSSKGVALPNDDGTPPGLFLRPVLAGGKDRDLPTRSRRASTTVLGIQGVTPLRKSLLGERQILVPANLGKAFEIPTFGNQDDGAR
jgi:hypothetical protein